MDVEQPGRVGSSALAGVNQRHDLVLLSGAQFWTATAQAALLAGRNEPAARALPQHGALKLGEGAHDLHHHASGWRGRVYGFGQAAEISTGKMRPLQQGQKVFK